jgi:hypothetical protein
MAIKDDMEDVQEAVINELITENGITNTLADDQVTENKIASNAVTTTKIADGAIIPSKLSSAISFSPAQNSLNSGQLADNAVTRPKIADNAVSTAKLAIGAVTAARIGAGEVGTLAIVDDAITPAKLSQSYLPLTGGSVSGDASVSGNFLVGKTASDFDGGVFEAGSGGTYVSRSGMPFGVNRNGSDGSITNFYKDGSTVGTIGAVSGRIFINSQGGGLSIKTADTDRIHIDATYLFPQTDNSYCIGSSANRFDDIFAANGTIQTSDENEKQDIEALSEAEQRVAVACKGLLRKFRWKSAVEEKGEEARIHFGIIAQDLQAAFEAEGLDAGRYAMFISSTWTDEETGEEKTRLGVRYSELLAFIISAI